MKVIFHLDLDAFFVSVERLLDPSLKGKAVIVGGDPKGRGVVAACSYEARKFGLHSAMPIRTAYRLCPRGIYLHGHYTDYSRWSREVRDILTSYAPVIQQASVDEFYMDYTGTEKIYGDPNSMAYFLQAEVMRKTGLPCSIGVGSNKTIAKIASDYKKPEGITYVPAGTEKEFLAPLPVEKIPGIGNKTKVKLNKLGFYYAGDIAKSPVEYFSSLFGRYGIDLWQKVNGMGNDVLTTEWEQKSISKETTFLENVSDKEVIRKKLFYLTGKICQHVRDDNWQASTIYIKLRYHDFQTITRSVTIKIPTGDDKIVFDEAWRLMERYITPGSLIRLIGVGIKNFVPFNKQQALFEDGEVKREKMLHAVGVVRNKFGYEKIGFTL